MTDNLRHDWQLNEIQALYDQPFNDLMFQAQTVHRQHFAPNSIQISTLLSIKTGACPEDCQYCPQSSRYTTGVKQERLLDVEKVLQRAAEAKQNGASRFCMGAAWKNPHPRDMPYLLEMVRGVKALGLETCMTLGMLAPQQAQALAAAGLDYYNHNVDTSEDYYKQIITTRTYQDRLNTLSHVRAAGMKVCSGGIVGMGEQGIDRIAMLQTLANLPQHPESVPINMLVKIAGTPLADSPDLAALDFVRVIATARILLPKSYVRLSAGRETMSEETQALCFLAGANSIFYGCKLLTTTNSAEDNDKQLFRKLGLQPAGGDAVTLAEAIPEAWQLVLGTEQVDNAENEANSQFYNAAEKG